MPRQTSGEISPASGRTRFSIIISIELKPTSQPFRGRFGDAWASMVVGNAEYQHLLAGKKGTSGLTISARATARPW
jgi:hypothetical protein